MNNQIFKPFLWLGVFILIVSIACSAASGSSTEEPQPPATTEQPSEEAPVTEAPPETKEPELSTAGVDDLQDVKMATIQIEAQGTFVDPEFGLVQNGAGRGSGFVIDPSGIAVTNNHVVTGAALLKVWVGGEDTPRNAKVLGVSECSDLAVIDIEGEGYEYLEWYDGTIDVGMDMYIAGYPLGDPEYTLTKGVISKANADGETYWSSVDSVVEYDATSNPGNSGGPVVTSDGEVLAIHYSGNAQTRQAFGISKTISTDIIEDLRSGYDVNSIGVNGQAVGTEDGSLTGVWVSSVQSGSPADQAGLQPGDIITEMEGLILATDGTLSQYCDILRSHQPSDTLSIQVLRWSSGEVLEGQLNGRQLEVSSVTGTGDTSGGETTGTDTGDAYIDENASQPGDPYYYTEFEGSLNDWFYFLISGDEDGFGAQTIDGRLQVEIGDNDTWVYLMNDYFEYFDVRIDTIAENLGRNNNNVSLICRESDQGWYEFNIANNGTYTILWFDDVTQHDYVLLYSGGSTEIRMGKDVNEYTAICSGDQLTLAINGVEVRTVTDKNLKSGRVGLSVSSFNVTPIIVEFDYFIASVP